MSPSFVKINWRALYLAVDVLTEAELLMMILLDPYQFRKTTLNPYLLASSQHYAYTRSRTLQYNKRTQSCAT